MAVQHLCQYLPQPLMLLMLLLTPPLLLAQGLADLSLAPLGIIGLAPPLMYVASQKQLYRSRGALRALTAFPALLFIGAGISLEQQPGGGQRAAGHRDALSPNAQIRARLETKPLRPLHRSHASGWSWR